MPERSAHTVVVQPSGARFEALDGETVFVAARRSGIAWPTRCVGQATCRQCYFEIAAGSRQLSEIGRLERDALRRIFVQPAPDHDVRLACQSAVHGDVEVYRLGVRAAASSPPVID